MQLHHIVFATKKNPNNPQSILILITVISLMVGVVMVIPSEDCVKTTPYKMASALLTTFPKYRLVII